MRADLLEVLERARRDRARLPDRERGLLGELVEQRHEPARDRLAAVLVALPGLEVGVVREPLGRRVDAPPGASGSSERCVKSEYVETRSISSPKSSMRTGVWPVDGKTSTMSPRTATWPRSSTASTRS